MYRISALVVFAGTSIAVGQGTLVPIPPHSSTYNGFSRGYNFTSSVPFMISRLELPLEAMQAGDTASFLVRVNGTVALRDVGGTSSFITPSIMINPGDVVDIIGNWSPAVTSNFSAHNSYAASGVINTTIEGVAHTMTRTGWQWDIGDPNWQNGPYLAPTGGQPGRIFMYTMPQSNDPGACCFNDGTCSFLSPTDCVNQGGAFHGAGSTCASTPCPQPEACCFFDGTCSMLVPATCTAQGGTSQGSGTTCVTPCPAPGACCLPNTGCVDLFASECATAGGVFHGSGSNCGEGQCWSSPVLYHNGGFITHPGQGANGADASQLPAGGNSIGENCNFAAGVRIADDFTVPAGETWTVNRLRTWAYQTSSVGFTMTNFYARIWDRDPSDPAAQVVWGDTGTFVTNVMNSAGSGLHNAYRVTTATGLQDTARQLQRLEAALPDVQLSGGTYWIEWSTTGSGASGPFIPPVTVLNDIPRGNAIIWRNAPWAPVVDTTWNLAQFPGGQPVGLPFVIEGSVGGCYANCDGSTEPPILNVADFGCFLSKYAAGDPYANCDNSTEPPVLNVADFGCFLGKYAAGCQ